MPDTYLPSTSSTPVWTESQPFSHLAKEASSSGVGQAEEAASIESDSGVGSLRQLEAQALDDGVDFFAVQGKRDRAKLEGKC